LAHIHYRKFATGGCVVSPPNRRIFNTKQQLFAIWDLEQNVNLDDSS